jgi:hypothetical protein
MPHSHQFLECPVEDHSDSNINPARTGTSSTPRKVQNIMPASLPQNNPPEGSHTITTIFTKNLLERLDNTKFQFLQD